MLRVTPELKSYMIATFALAATATDDDVRKSVGEQIVAGKLELSKVSELTAVKASDAEIKLKGMIDASVAGAMVEIKSLLAANKPAEAAAVGTAGAATAPAGEKAVTAPAGAASSTANLGAKAYAAAGMAGQASAGGQAGEFEGSADHVRVKSVVEQFNDTRTAATWNKSANRYLSSSNELASQQVTKFVESLPYTVDMPTERSKAITGAWFKKRALDSMRRQNREIPAHLELKEIDKQLITYAIHECKFIGEVGGAGMSYDYEGEKLFNDLHRKAVLDDSTSGGLEAVPIEFDSSVILTPLLNGELFPLVNIVNVSRRRIEAAKIGNPTMSWGTAEGTAIPLFDTASFISAFDNSVYPITGAIELGLDFLADSPLAVGAIVVQRYGERFKTEMDNVIVNGNGTNRPEGVFTAAGTTAVSAASAGAGPAVGDYEGLMFGVPKQYRQEAGLRPESSRAVFIGTDVSYRRARGIPVNSTNDARRIFGMDEMSYTLFGYKYAIGAAAGFLNSSLGFCCMNRYRMYRRQGLEVQYVRGTDWDLVRRNMEGIVVRARFGGALEDGAAMAKMTDSVA